jgi:hypothetical protein
MRAWCSLGGFAGESRLRTGRQSPQLARAIEFYFGKEAASRIDDCRNWRTADHHLIPVTRSLFNAFLGRKAADALVVKITGMAT